MKLISENQVTSLARSIDESTPYPINDLTAPQKLALTVAMMATLASLGIATYAGWQSGGLPLERVMRVAIFCIAVLVLHWLPSGWSAFRGIAQFCTLTLWIVAAIVVLFGQTNFFMTSQRHAGDLRAATVLTPVAPKNPDLHPGRSRTDIAKEVAKVSANLARAQMQPCPFVCSTLKMRRIRLEAEMAALGVEADEAKRRETEEDWLKSQTMRDEDRREALRADPVALSIASLLGTTESSFQLIVGFANAVVLEGAAILGWTFVAVELGRSAGRSVVAPDNVQGTSDSDPMDLAETSPALLSEEGQHLARIRTAVVIGELKPTQTAIRNFLHCGQPKAGKLNRLYQEKYGSTQGVAVASGQDAVVTRFSIGVVK